MGIIRAHGEMRGVFIPVVSGGTGNDGARLPV